MIIPIAVPNRELLKRLTSTAILVTYSAVIFYYGPVCLIITTLLVQLQCFREVMNVVYGRDLNTPRYARPIGWYLVFTANCYFFGEHLGDHFDVFIRRVPLLQKFVRYHRFIAYCLYLSGLLWFLMRVVRRYGRREFKFLALVHVLLLMIVLQSYMVVDQIFNGIVWLLLTSVIVTVNDIYAFAVGRLCGRTPLIEVSPKKTWEGYVGAAVGTVVTGVLLGHLCCTVDYLVCPVEYVDTAGHGIVMVSDNCSRSYIFTADWHDFNILGSMLHVSIYTYPFVLHMVVISVFASIIGPFGGFFASGFKRAFNVKNFGDTIPGHGGIMDRFDCFFLMVTFVNVYINAFVDSQTIGKIFRGVLQMSDDDQLQFFHLLEKSLEASLLLGNGTTELGPM